MNASRQFNRFLHAPVKNMQLIRPIRQSMNTYIARQPIFDRKIHVKAYELLFRSDDRATQFTDIDQDQASSHVVMESFHTMGVEVLTSGRPAFINFTSTLLLENIATLFPKDLLVIELLENIEPTPEIIRACHDLYKKGYVLALDDFVYHPSLEPLIKLCQIIKFDFLQNTPQEIADMLKHMDTRGKQLLAEKIETMDCFNTAVKMGFSLFQGYFFSKPVTLTSKKLVPLQENYIALLKEIHTEHDVDFARISRIIHKDVALSYKLLRLVNSVFYGMRFKATDIKHALAVLGTREIRKWILLMTIMRLNSNKPDEIIKMSLIRGRFMELMHSYCRKNLSYENLFLTGLFSMIDVLVEKPMEDALTDLPLAPQVRDALVKRKGTLHDLLNMVVCLERSEWDEADKLAELFNVNTGQVSNIYINAVKWCNEMPF